MTKIIPKFTISGELANFGEFDTVLSEIEDSGAKCMDLHICSEGGDIYLSHAIAARIIQSPLIINAYGYGAVMSGAVIPFIVCKKRFLSKWAFMMIHDTSTFNNDGEGKTSTQLTQEANHTRQFDDQDYRILADYTNKGYKYWYNKIKGKGDIYITAKEALELGLCDQLF
jgi:ATP-dependent protease ClpP protease subunit